MSNDDLQLLLKRVQSWPESAQRELVAIADEIESDLVDRDYVASDDELRAIDTAIVSIDAGHSATETEIAAAFAKFRQA